MIPSFCSHCNRSGHDASKCFQLVSYPKCWDDRPWTMRGDAAGRGGRSSRGRGGHGMGPSARANKVVAGGSGDKPIGRNGASSLQPRDPVRVDLAGINTEQWQQLLDMLNLPKLKDRSNGESLWISDTGAIHHVTSTISQWTTTRKINGCPVGFPDCSLQKLLMREMSLFLAISNLLMYYMCLILIVILFISRSY